MESVISRSSADTSSTDINSRRLTSESSNMSTTSSGADSIVSLDSFSIDKELSGISLQMDQLAFMNNRSSRYFQLIDDLAIIDEIYQSFDTEIESDPYERQVADAARNVAQKKRSADDLFESEEKFVNDLSIHKSVYLIPLAEWLKQSGNEEFFEKYKGLGPKNVLNNLIRQYADITKTHQMFLREFKERLNMWGPTQFISDIFANFYDHLTVYEPFLNSYSSTVVTLDLLYRQCSSFTKFLNLCQSNKTDPNTQEVIYYLKAPLARMSLYTSLISQMAMATEPAHPDYRSLGLIRDKFVAREAQWKSTIKDRLAHVNVLEATRVIQGNPASVTSSRRLYISGTLTRIEPSDPHSTTDTRTYLLYNDMFMYTQKLKPNSKGSLSSVKLQYKGMISLKHAEIVPLSSQLVAKFQEGPKVSKLSFMRRNGSLNSDSSTTIYGFEIRINETARSESVSMGSDTYIVPGHSSGNGSKRQILFRAENEAEQNRWIALLRIVSKHATRKR